MDNQNLLLDIFEKIRKLLTSNGYFVSNYDLIDYGIQFTIMNQNKTGIIRIYQNKKGIIKLDYSQLKDDIDPLRVRTLIEQELQRYSHTLQQDSKEYGYPIIGTDESGKGDYFGPLVCAGVYVTKDSYHKLLEIGVKDSKKLKDNRIKELAGRIYNIVKGKFAIIEISPEKYNQLYSEFKSEGKTLNTLLAWGHAKALEELLNKVQCNLAIADQFADEKFIISKLQEKGQSIRLIQQTKAEANIAVAAASILARTRFLEKLEKLSNLYRIELPKGASNVVIGVAEIFVSKYGKEKLKLIAKLHFKTTKKIVD